jgi:hypothetical protein
MAITPQNFGPCRLFAQFWADTAGNWADPLPLGFSENGVDVSEETRSMPVHSDETGGQAGNEFDFQEMGERHVLRIVLSRWEATVLERMKKPWPLAPGEVFDPGVPPRVGALRFVEGGFFRLVMLGETSCRVYGKCFLPNEPRTVNVGTRHSLAGFGVTCMPARFTPQTFADVATWRLFVDRTGQNRYADAVNWWSGKVYT